MADATSPDPASQGTAGSARAPARVAVIIPAKDEADRVAATIGACAAIPDVDVVVVVDDGSTDGTSQVARQAGALVERHARNRGKAAAMETGAAAVERLDVADRPRAPRALLFVDADLGATAGATAALIDPVRSGQADMTIAVLPAQQTPGGGRGLVVNLARRGITSATGWTPTQPLSGMRCLSREAFEAARPLARGWGVETAMTIDLLLRGLQVREVPCELQHRVTGRDWRAQLHRARQYRDVALALAVRRRRVRT